MSDQEQQGAKRAMASDEEQQGAKRAMASEDADVEGYSAKRSMATDQPADDDTDEPEVEGHALRALDKPNEGKGYMKRSYD